MNRVAVLDASIDFHQNALNLCHAGHPDQFVLLISLTTALLECFKRGGRDADSEESTKLHRSALQRWPSDHPDRYSPLVNLANCLSMCLGHSGQIDDLDKSIQYYQEALDLCTDGHADRPLLLSKLAFCLCTRFKQYGQLHDLNHSITLHHEALVLNPKGHPNRSSTLSNLVNALLTRFQHDCKVEDLKESIKCHWEALRLRPVGHIDRPSSLTNLANALLANFEHSGKEEDLRISISNHGKALDLCPEGHHDRSAALGALGHAYFTRFRLSRLSDDFEQSIQLLELATAHTFSSVLVRLEAARKWAEYARSHTHYSTLNAYSTAMLLLQRAFSVSPTLSTQRTFLLQNTKYKALALDAASFAIAEGKRDEAVELLEQGRTLLWSQMRGFRTPLEWLSGTNKDLADRFKRVSRQLENLVTSNSNTDRPVSGSHMFSSNTEQQSFDEMLNLKHQLLDHQEEAISEIRRIPGFESFLAATPFKVLQRPATEGPVIVVNHCKHRSDALIILDREDLPVDRVVSKVVDKLNELGIAEGSRIWWCTTSLLSALPFHAAGPFEDTNGTMAYLLDKYVSSYTPTLGALINARLDGVRGEPTVLVIGDTSLRSAKQEIRNIRNCGISTKLLIDKKASRDAVITALPGTEWAHFTCHGNMDPEPFNSLLKLPSGGLTLLDIVRANLPEAEFAFLSACHSAEIAHDSVYDEVLHLAAAMQFSGFRSVIGSMWELLDEDRPLFAKAVYAYMCDCDEGDVRYKRAATGLRKAALDLRAREGLATERWVNLIHIGD
ncbi:uncharacterized protein FOMMEDRAFT_159082 [Fomitiporia mediterranea MF3/22]|uniref:uncharacterized protein n=1 Tax=Fomitiporia mediterranea (strain MF3/22) TaxID=694068 RepID=UPI0004409497|nr:uncharacterized protein FOMMEDRAFT_159082 [Fomitiporia mediterranea MF3/22]EJD00404.1 hypothetical protein FOMMEDRAFT_159082 [Fomitiporia mediterranea MF3/22]